MAPEPYTYHGITVRPAKGDEAEALSAFFHRAGAETDNLSFSEADCPYTVEKCRAFINACRAERCLLLLAYDGDTLIGELSLTDAGRKRFDHTRELGIAILLPYTGKGLGSFMLETALKQADA